MIVKIQPNISAAKPMRISNYNIYARYKTSLEKNLY